MAATEYVYQKLCCVYGQYYLEKYKIQLTGGGGAYLRCQALKCPHQFRANLGSAYLLTEGGSSRTCRESTLAKGEQGVLHTQGQWTTMTKKIEKKKEN